MADMPLFPDEADIARAVLGPRGARDWKTIVPSLKRQGFLRMDPVFGARYRPAVKAWMDRRAGLTTMTVPARPGGKETWK